MRANVELYKPHQVFLNYPFDAAFVPLANAMQFAVVAAGLIPLSAADLTTPDWPRLDMLVKAISSCHYSAHDLSRSTGQGPHNLARMNMPLEMGMAIFHAIASQRKDHRCIFFVPKPHEHQRFASDLAGLDPRCHEDDGGVLVTHLYDWLRNVVPPALFNLRPTTLVLDHYHDFVARLAQLRGSSPDGGASREETREILYELCTEAGWWDWRQTRAGQLEFPKVPLTWKMER